MWQYEPNLITKQCPEDRFEKGIPVPGYYLVTFISLQVINAPKWINAQKTLCKKVHFSIFNGQFSDLTS